MGTISYNNLRDNLAKVWDKVEDSQEPELDGLRETAHLLRSPRNAVRLLTALQRALADRPSQATTV